MCSPKKGNKIRSGCLTLAFLGAQKRAEMLRHPCILGDPQTKGDNIGSGSLTPAFSGAHKWVEMLRHPCILGDPQNKGGQNQKWVPHPCLLGSPKKGGNAPSPLHSGGSLAQGTKSKVAELGARTKLWMCNPKEYNQKNFAAMVCLRPKTPLNPPHGPFLKKKKKRRGRFQNPPRYRISQTPPPALVYKIAICYTTRNGAQCSVVRSRGWKNTSGKVVRPT